MLTEILQKQLITVNKSCKRAFYNDISAEKAQRLFEALSPHSQVALETPVEFVAADLTIPKAYIICELDEVGNDM